MLVRKFNFEEDPEYGEDGWMPSWMKGANIVNGLAAAHDMLEHHPNMALGAEAEFHALGACWWLRGQTGMLGGYRTPEENIAGDFISILERVAFGQETLNRPPDARRLSSYYFGDADDDLNEIVRKGMEMFSNEWEYRDEGPASIPHDSSKRILNWMRLGYRYASARYGMGREYDMSHLFSQIAAEVDRHAVADLGSVLTVRANLKTLRAHAFVTSPREDDY